MRARGNDNSSARVNALSREDDRKYNVLCFGIEECSETSRIDRLNSDLDKVTSLVSSIDSHVDKSSIRDSFRLGKFKKDSSNPRLILVKFTRSADAAKRFNYRSLNLICHLSKELWKKYY